VPPNSRVKGSLKLGIFSRYLGIPTPPHRIAALTIRFINTCFELLLSALIGCKMGLRGFKRQGHRFHPNEAVQQMIRSANVSRIIHCFEGAASVCAKTRAVAYASADRAVGVLVDLNLDHYKRGAWSCSKHSRSMRLKLQ